MALNQNPISYTSRTYNTILSDINSDATLVQKPNWFKRLIAGLGDSLSIWLNSMVNLMFLRTSYTRSAVQDLCQLIDYYLAGQITSSGSVIFYVDTSLGTAIFPFTLQPVDLVAKSIGYLSISSMQFESRVQQTFSSISDTFTTDYATNSDLTVSVDFALSGHKVRVSSSGTLPNPLQADKDYYIVYLNATTIRLALTLADAYAGNYVTLTTNGTGTHTIDLYSKSISMYQQKSLSASIVFGTSDGLTQWQEFDLPDSNVIIDTLIITINGIQWNKVDTFVNSISTDKVFKIYQKSNGIYSVKFGNGTYGAIPGNFDLYAEYATGGGVNSNINSKNIVTLYAGASSNITGVSNATIMTGGSDPETIVNAKNLAPALLKATYRFITVNDGIALVLAYGGVANCIVNKNTYGTLSCQVCGVATGGGDVDSTLRSTIQQYLIDNSILSSIDVRFEASTITAINVDIDVNIYAGYVWSTIEPYIDLGVRLFISETGKQINDTYQASGIEAAVTLINNIFSKTFSTPDYAAIIALLKNYNLYYRNFNDLIQQSDFFAFMQGSIAGINYITVNTFGSGFPLQLGTAEISTVGTIVITQV